MVDTNNTDGRQSLSDLGTVLQQQGEAAEAAAEQRAEDYLEGKIDEPVQTAPLRAQELDKFGRAYATGRRKDAVARVWLKPGTGKITVNGRDQEVYFARPTSAPKSISKARSTSRSRPRRCARRNSTNSVVLTRPAAARTPSRASG